MFHLSLNFLFLANEIIANVAEVLNLKSSGYQEVPKYSCDRAVDCVDYVDPIPPNYFKLGSLAKVDEEKKVITIKAAENLLEILGKYLLEILGMELLLMLKLQQF